MSTITSNKNAFQFALWLFAALVLLTLLTSCSPYVKKTPTPTPSENPAGEVFYAPADWFTYGTPETPVFVTPSPLDGRINHQGD